MGAALRFFPSSGIRTFLRLLVGGIRLQNGSRRLREGTAGVRLKDNLKILNPLKLAKLHNRPTGSVGSRTKEIESKPGNKDKPQELAPSG